MTITADNIKCSFEIKKKYGNHYLSVRVQNNYSNAITAKVYYTTFKLSDIVDQKNEVWLSDISPGQTMEQDREIYFSLEVERVKLEKIEFWSIEENRGTFVALSQEFKKPGCFIATACFGYDDLVVLQLQKFRDEHLARTSFGRMLISRYYAVSPEIASYISQKPVLKNIVRKLILTFAFFLPKV